MVHLQNVCISPVTLSMQSVAVRGSNKRCIATCLHLSVYEIATHFLMNFLSATILMGMKVAHPRELKEHGDSGSPFKLWQPMMTPE